MEDGQVPSAESGIDMTPAELAREQLKQAEHEADAKAAIKAEPKKVSKEDMLKVEVLYLKITNCRMQEEVMKRDMIKLQEDKAKFQQEMIALSKEYAVKYGIELGKAQILPDGTVVTPPTNGN